MARSRRCGDAVIRLHECSDSVVTIYVDVEVQVTNFRNAVLRPLAAAGAERIGSDIDVRAIVVLVAQPREIARRDGLLKRHDALHRRSWVLSAEQESNRLSWVEASG